ncbi:MAG: hypothetical protein MJ244_01285 [Clostridia bacterium]|nr:hypothetical protein [Clostridia bacterium]
MRNLTIEKNFLLHLLVLTIVFLGLNYFYNFNLFTETENAIKEYESLAIEELNIIRNDTLNNKELDDYQMFEYINLNENAINDTIYLLNYYIPAFYILLILLLVLLEKWIYKRWTFYKLEKTFNSGKDRSKEQLIKIIKAKLDYRYKRINLPKHIPYMCVFLYLITMFINPENVIMLRVFNNMVFALMCIITIFGFRIVIRFFRTRSDIARFLIIVLNIFIGMLIPQMYFIIGFIRSLWNVRIVIKAK